MAAGARTDDGTFDFGHWSAHFARWQARDDADEARRSRGQDWRSVLAAMHGNVVEHGTEGMTQAEKDARVILTDPDGSVLTAGGWRQLNMGSIGVGTTGPTSTVTSSVSSSRNSTGPIYDIYLSAGVPEDGFSCDEDSVGVCELYQVKWDFGTMSAVSVTKLVDRDGYTVGVVEPAVSPDGSHLSAVLTPEASGGEVSGRWIVEWDILGETLAWSADDIVATWGREADSGVGGPAQFPNYYDDDTILFSVSDSGDSHSGQLWRATRGTSSGWDASVFMGTDASARWPSSYR